MHLLKIRKINYFKYIISIILRDIVKKYKQTVNAHDILTREIQSGDLVVKNETVFVRKASTVGLSVETFE